MDDVLPAFETFYDSLTDEQKADLMPERGRHGSMHRGPDMAAPPRKQRPKAERQAGPGHGSGPDFHHRR